jgi:dihydrofolate reductase
MRPLTYYVGSSIDGFIATAQVGVDDFAPGEDLLAHIAAEYPDTVPTHLRAALGVPVDAPPTRFDTVVMGRATYAPALDVGITRPYAHLREVVVSRTLAPTPDGVEVEAGDRVALGRRLKAEEGLGIWLAGGGQLAGALLDEVDELVVKVYPLVLGSGVPLFAPSRGWAVARWRLAGQHVLGSGPVVSTYARERRR